MIFYDMLPNGTFWSVDFAMQQRPIHWDSRGMLSLQVTWMSIRFTLAAMSSVR